MMSSSVKYNLNGNGSFTIKDYNNAKTFSNFFPGIAGLWGIPMWVFYVNRGQCISSFGIESKDKAIMEFQPANKAYRLTALQGMRTFIKVKCGSKTTYWEPFQNYLLGTDFKKTQSLSMTAHDLTLEEKNEELGLSIKVNYFTLPDEPFAALVRQVELKNLGAKSVDIEIIDGMPVITPYGLTDSIAKNMARTVEAWVKVRNLENKAPYYQLNVEVADTPVVTHIHEGNFFISFDSQSKELLAPIVEASQVFGQASDFSAPQQFLRDDFSLASVQNCESKTPAALSYHTLTLAPKKAGGITSLFGYAQTQDQFNEIVEQVSQSSFIKGKATQNKEMIDEIKNFTFTQSALENFNLYAQHTFLDNILRGGLPISIKTSEGNVSFNVYSRKHGDLERDYNFFTIAPTFYSQGNGNYRDVNQNRRNDVWFNTDVRDGHLINFLNLSQADGYNPLIVKGTSFMLEDSKALDALLKKSVNHGDLNQLKEFLCQGFLPGDLLTYLKDHGFELKIDAKDFFGQILEMGHKQELADHGEGFWSDHWTYNLDLIESYLAVFPENLKALLLEQNAFTFFHNNYYVRPRKERFVLTERGVRQYQAVNLDDAIFMGPEGHNSILKEKYGEGAVHQTHLTCKLLCLIVNKTASLDPSGIGVEMESDKPNWYDALNGLPGLVGSAISETFEIKRFCQFLLSAFKQLKLKDTDTITVFEELATFMTGLSNILTVENDGFSYWTKANDIKENYRNRIRYGIDGKLVELSLKEVHNFLELVVAKTNQAAELAQNKDGFLSTYFYHEVADYKKFDNHSEEDLTLVEPKKFKRHDLPLFLEGYVHALKVQDKIEDAKALYSQVRQSPIYDKKLKMYKVNADLSKETEEIGRTRIFPRGWLENESIWMHMEYKFMLELLRAGLYDEFYDNFKNVLIPFLKPDQYGRSILENSSFIASSAHEDENVHGQGFVARLSGSTAEFLHIWLMMNAGKSPFTLDAKGNLILSFQPALKADLFTVKETKNIYLNGHKEKKEVILPANTYAFMFLGSTLVVYHNPKKLDTFGSKATSVKEIELTYYGQKPKKVSGSIITNSDAQDVRAHQIERIDLHLA